MNKINGDAILRYYSLIKEKTFAIPHEAKQSHAAKGEARSGDEA